MHMNIQVVIEPIGSGFDFHSSCEIKLMLERNRILWNPNFNSAGHHVEAADR